MRTVPTRRVSGPVRAVTELRSEYRFHPSQAGLPRAAHRRHRLIRVRGREEEIEVFTLAEDAVAPSN